MKFTQEYIGNLKENMAKLKIRELTIQVRVNEKIYDIVFQMLNLWENTVEDIDFEVISNSITINDCYNCEVV